MTIARIMVLAALGSALGCGIDERSDFLIGRQCVRGDPRSCDPGQVCLAHSWRGGQTFTDYRCRDEASFLVPDAPIAYCSDAEPCPGDLVCNADRVRIDTSVRPLVCKTADDPFAPPLDGGV